MVRFLRVAMLALLIVPFLALASPPDTAAAAEFRAVDSLTIGAGEVLDDDLYVTANTVTIDGRVTGDAFILAQTVTIRGQVGGSLNAGAATVVLAPGSSIGGTARIAAGTIEAAGQVGRDLLAAGDTVTIPAGATVGGDLYAGATTTTIGGSIGAEAALASERTVVSGSVGGNLRVNGTTLDLQPSAVVGGSLTYTEGTAVTQATGSRIAGPTTEVARPQSEARQDQPADPVRSLVGEVIGRFIAFLMGLLVGAILIGLLPRASWTVAETFRQSPWWSLLTGFVALIVLPLLALAFAVTIIGLPVSLLLVAAWIVGLYLAPLTAGFVLAWLVLGGLREPGRLRQFLLFALGLVVVSIVTAIPFAGAVIGVLLAVTGLGALLYTGLVAANRRIVPA